MQRTPPRTQNQRPQGDERGAYVCEIKYSVSIQESSNTKSSLVDRGANGGIAGSDCRIIASTVDPRRVDIVGIAGNELPKVPIGTVGSYVETNKGPVIAIWHQYAMHMEGASIHSSGQMEHHKIQVSDKSMKVGGMQRIRTPDGYIMPLDVRNGLVYLPMRPCADEEYDTLPQI